MLQPHCMMFHHRTMNRIYCQYGDPTYYATAEPIFVDSAVKLHYNKHCCCKYTECPNYKKLMGGQACVTN